MTATRSTSTDVQQQKHDQAKQLTTAMGMYQLQYHPDAVAATENPQDTVVEKQSEGHLHLLTSIDLGAFPELPGETWLDDRDNGGDLAQTIVDQLHRVARDYQQVAETVARRLDRVPKIEEAGYTLSDADRRVARMAKTIQYVTSVNTFVENLQWLVDHGWATCSEKDVRRAVAEFVANLKEME